MALYNEKVHDVDSGKYGRFEKSGIKYIDYKNPDFLLKLVNDNGKLCQEELLGLV